MQDNKCQKLKAKTKSRLNLGERYVDRTNNYDEIYNIDDACVYGELYN